MSGWILDYRKELDSDIWLLPPMYHRTWQWIKYKVNHAPGRIPNKDGTFTTIDPGQHATSLRLIAKGVGYYEGLKWKEPNPKTIKTILNWLEVQEMIVVQGNSLGTVITVANWDLYQKELTQGNTTETLEKHRLDTNNNNKQQLKNNKDTIKRFIPPSFDEVTGYCQERKNNIDAQNFIDHYEANGWMRGKNKIKSWKACVRTWEKNTFSKPSVQVKKNESIHNFDERSNSVPTQDMLNMKKEIK